MRNRSLASNPIFRTPTLLPKIDESTLPRERAVMVGQEARAGAPADEAKQAVHSGRFSVAALLARLWHPF
jgi:hypothetical protein